MSCVGEFRVGRPSFKHNAANVLFHNFPNTENKPRIISYTLFPLILYGGWVVVFSEHPPPSRPDLLPVKCRIFIHGVTYCVSRVHKIIIRRRRGGVVAKINWTWKSHVPRLFHLILQHTKRQGAARGISMGEWLERIKSIVLCSLRNHGDGGQICWTNWMMTVNKRMGDPDRIRGLWKMKAISLGYPSELNPPSCLSSAEDKLGNEFDFYFYIMTSR